jgi:D-arabinose 1-dehydrogenase-like Zn-dependent alcohol dehydrogenase
MKISRQGAIGALLDEYERALSDFKKVLEPVTDQMLATVVDPHTADENCRSLQTILTHVVSAGFAFAVNIRNLSEDKVVRPPKTIRGTVAAYVADLDAMFRFTEEVLGTLKDADLEQFDNSRKILTTFGQLYDAEQMMEHAIVHILRHRRQCERFVKLLLAGEQAV